MEVLRGLAHHQRVGVDDPLGEDPRVGVDALAHRVAAHVLDAAGDGDVVGAEGDARGGVGDRGHRARAHAVDGVAGDALRQAGEQRGGAADGQALVADLGGGGDRRPRPPARAAATGCGACSSRMHLMTRSSARVSAYWPLALPNGVRTPSTKTTSRSWTGHGLSWCWMWDGQGDASRYPSVTTTCPVERVCAGSRPAHSLGCGHGRTRLVHIVDDARGRRRRRRPHDGRRARPASSTRASPRSVAARHLASARREGRVVATFDVDALHDYRARRPPCRSSATTTRATRRPRLVVRALRDTGGTPYLLLHRPRARRPLGGLRARGARGRRALRRAPRGQPGRRADGRAAHPADRDHPARQPRRAAHRREPVARRAPGPVQRPVAARDPAGGVGPRRARLRRAHPALPRADGVPRRPRPSLLEQLELGGHLVLDLTELREAAEITETEIERYLASHDEVERGRARPRAAVRRVPRGRGVRQLAARRATSRCRPARRSASSSSSSWPASTTRRRGPGLMAGSGSQELVEPCSTSRARRRPVPGQPARHRAPARLRRPGGRPGGGGRRPAASTPAVRPALAALLLPAARRPGRADRLRRRAHPRRPLLRDPAGHGAPARPADLLP